MSADGSFAFSSAPTPEELARFDLNDLGNAMRLIRLVGGQVLEDGGVEVSGANLLFVLGLGWLGYNGRYWDREFGDQLASRKAHEVAVTVRGLYAELSAAHSGANAKEIFRFIDGCGNRGALSAMLAVAQPYLTVRIDAFDRHPLTVNCQNATLWLSWDGETFRAEPRPHNPGDRLTRCANVAHDPEAACPLFRKVLADSLPIAPERAAFGRMLGYASTGLIHEQAFFFNQGPGQDGKSTLLDACRETLGTYAAVVRPETYLEGVQTNGSGPQPDVVALAGDTRFAIVSEPKRGSRLNEGLLKAWTGGTPVTARDLNAKPITFRPITKLIWEMNALVVARGDDDGIWRRIKPVLFRHKVPDDQVDKRLPEKLQGEATGILNWLVEQVGQWLQHGLDWPASLAEVLDQYRRTSSPFGDWLQERCVWGETAKGERTLSRELHANFKAWAEDQGQDKPMSERAFGDALRDRQIGLAGKNGKGQKYRGPIRLKTEFELGEDMVAAERAAALALAGGGNESPSGAGGSSAGAPPEPGAFDGDEDWPGS